MPGKCALTHMVCPETADASKRHYCPSWWETVFTNGQGETKVNSGCAWRQLPEYMVEVIRAANAAAVAAQEGRNEVGGLAQHVDQGFVVFAHALKVPHYAGPDQLTHAPGAGRHSPAIGYRSPDDVEPAVAGPQYAGQRDDGAASNGVAGNGADLLRHDVGHPDLVERNGVD